MDYLAHGSPNGSATPPMASSTTKTLLLIALGLLLLIGGVYRFLGGADERIERTPPRVAREAPEPVGSEADSAREEAPRTELLAPPLLEFGTEELARSTVLWPLRVELDLIRANYLPTEKGVVPVGSGADARLSGRITGANDDGVAAEVHFVAGPNNGRKLVTDSSGDFGANDLYPGLSIVEVRGDRLIGSRREVRLRANTEALLNIGYGRPGKVQGRVQDRKGVGLEGASVLFDGTRTTTGPEGEFYLPSVAAGQVLVEVELEGYASYQELVWVAAARLTQADRLTFTLHPSTELTVAVTSNAGGPGPVELYLLPAQLRHRLDAASAHRNMRFPFHRINPIEVQPGVPVTIPNLPAESVKVFAFRPGAKATMKIANLRADRANSVQIGLEPAPKISGKVVFDGEPVAGATVRLEAPNRTRALLSFFKEGSHYLETAVMPFFPPAVQEVTTDASGRYVVSAWADQSATRFLEARGPDGRTWTGRMVSARDDAVTLELEEVELGDSTLALDFPERWQGLPVEVWIEGKPHDPEMLAPGRELVVNRLLAGRWRVDLSWHSNPVHEQELEIDGRETLRVELPVECIEGQDEDSWRRAGREYPAEG